MLARFWFDAAKGLNTRISKNASSPDCQKPLQRMSSRASSWAFALRLSSLSPVRGWSVGSISVLVFLLGFARKPNMAARRLVRAIFEISPFRK